MRDITWIVLKDLRQQVRDRTIFIFGLIAPLAIATALSLAFGGFFQNDEIALFRFGLYNGDAGGPISEGFSGAMAELEQDGLLEVSFFRDRASLATAVEEGAVDAGFVIPGGFSQALIGGLDTQITVVANPGSTVVTGVAAAIARQFSLEVASAGAAAATAAILGGFGQEQMIELGLLASRAPPTAQLASVGTRVRQLDGATYYSAGAAIFFIMFVVGTGLLSLLEERRRNTLARLLSSPVPPGRILAAKFILSFAVGLGSVGLFMLFSRLLLGANWVNLPVTALMVLATVGACTGIVSIVGGWARNAQQAQNVQSVLAVTMGILGGAFFPLAGGSTLLGALSLATPHAWFMRGLGDLSGGGGIDVVALPLLVLGSMTVAGLAISVLGARRRLRP